MKVLLVQPPIEDFYDTSIRTYPLGLLYLAAAVGDIADVVVLDARTGSKPERLGGHEFHELEPFYKEGTYTPFSFFSHYSRFGLTFGEIKRAVEKEKPDVVAVASMCSAYERQALEVAMAAKEASREIVTVMGGVHPTLFPERLLSHRDVDYCVRGEGETPFFELVSALSHGNIKCLYPNHGLGSDTVSLSGHRGSLCKLSFDISRIDWPDAQAVSAI